MIRAVMAGMGVALVPRCLVQDEITSGLVEEPLPNGGYRGSEGYWFCYPEGRGQLATLDHFRHWLLAEVDRSGEATALPLAAPA
ncbi:LysR substrate binding domain protein [compost metagenome]